MSHRSIIPISAFLLGALSPGNIYTGYHQSGGVFLALPEACTRELALVGNCGRGAAGEVGRGLAGRDVDELVVCDDRSIRAHECVSGDGVGDVDDGDLFAHERPLQVVVIEKGVGPDTDDDADDADDHKPIPVVLVHRISPCGGG